MVRGFSSVGSIPLYVLDFCNAGPGVPAGLAEQLARELGLRSRGPELEDQLRRLGAGGPALAGSGAQGNRGRGAFREIRCNMLAAYFHFHAFHMPHSTSGSLEDI